MTVVEIILTISLSAAALGLIIELSSNRRLRKVSIDRGGRPDILHHNLRLLGNFKYKNGRIFYHCFCIGPFPFFPLGCYQGEHRNSADIVSRQSGNFFELFALFSRWGWLVAIICLLTIIA